MSFYIPVYPSNVCMYVCEGLGVCVHILFSTVAKLQYK